MKNIALLAFGIAALLTIGILIYSAETAPVYQIGDAKLINLESDPLQSSDSLITIAPIQLGKTRFFLTAQAKYTINGMLVSKHRYRRGFMSRLSPYDYALVWGKVPTMLPYLKFSQTFRFCLFNYKTDASLDLNYIQLHFSNNHLIPSTPNISKALRTAKKKDLIRIEGYLVNVIAKVKNKGTSSWKTSTKRDDNWGGACEIIYITKLQIDDKIFE